MSKPAYPSGPVTDNPESSWVTVQFSKRRIARMIGAGCTLMVGQAVMRTVPPVTAAAAANGTAFDRSGSMCQCRAWIRPGSTATDS